MDRPQQQWCTVTDAGKLPPDLGADFLCAQIQQALAQVPAKPAAVDVKVKSAYLASASVTLASGQTLPDITVGSADRPLSRGSIEMLAEVIAARVGQQ